jgi:DNA repair exonuclease SbcCD ATPase subunit
MTIEQAAKRYRRKYEAARRAADRAQDDAEYNRAIARLHAANEEYEATKLEGGACPGCGQPAGVSHLGTCSRSRMHGGVPAC